MCGNHLLVRNTSTTTEVSIYGNIVLHSYNIFVRETIQQYSTTVVLPVYYDTMTQKLSPVYSIPEPMYRLHDPVSYLSTLHCYDTTVEPIKLRLSTS